MYMYTYLSNSNIYETGTQQMPQESTFLLSFFCIQTCDEKIQSKNQGRSQSKGDGMVSWTQSNMMFVENPAFKDQEKDGKGWTWMGQKGKLITLIDVAILGKATKLRCTNHLRSNFSVMKCPSFG